MPFCDAMLGEAANQYMRNKTKAGRDVFIEINVEAATELQSWRRLMLHNRECDIIEPVESLFRHPLRLFAFTPPYPLAP